MTERTTEDLPSFVPPMLAKLGEPFDSDEHFFEIKWDGIRAQALIEDGEYRLRSRTDRDLKPRYPELGFLADLPSGTVLDGELVVMRDGRSDFSAVMTREQARQPRRVQGLMRTHPVSYIVFDITYAAGVSVMELPLVERRALLEKLIEPSDPRVVLSDGAVGGGLAYYEAARDLKLEGVVAKLLTSPYSPGRRTDAWVKMKPTQQMHCVILGYLSDGDDLRSLILGTEDEGRLVCVGRVGSGLTAAMRLRIFNLCQSRLREEPLIDCGESGKSASPDLREQWVEPGLYCVVSFVERTKQGSLRAPVFVTLTDDSA